MVRNEDIPARVHRHVREIAEAAAHRVDLRAAVDRAHGRTSRARHDLLHLTVDIIRNEDIPARVHGHASGIVEAAAHRVDRRAAVDRASGRHNLLHRIFAPIRYENIPARVHRHASGTAEAAAHRVDRRAAIHRAHGRTSRARHDLLHRPVVIIRDEDIPARVHRHAMGIAEAAAQHTQRPRAKRDLWPCTHSGNIYRCDHCALAAPQAAHQFHSSQALTRKFRRKVYVHQAGLSAGVDVAGSIGGAAPGASIREVLTCRTLRQHYRSTDLSRRKREL